jgi:outer membrane receptor protein involved in Fe transport
MRKFRTSSWVARTTFLLVGLLFTASMIMAQVTTGALQGVVKDPNGAVVAGATVKITNNDTGQSRETTTNDEGFYRATNLQPGDNYRIEISGGGFTPMTIDKIAVRLATENTADVAFTAAGGVTSSVTVTGEETLIQSTQNQLSATYSPRQLTQLPFNGGSIDNLALLTPGVTTPGDTDFTNGVGISANGNRGRSNNFQIDGQDNNDNSVAGPSLTLTNTDAVGEYQVITNNFSAEFGRNSGAQINVITKPGTNDFHGSLFEYHNNSALDARTNTDKRSQAGYKFLAANGFPQFTGLSLRRLDPYRYNRFGGAVGGPIKENKAFFFVTYQRDIQKGETQINSLNTGSIQFLPDSAALAASLGFPGATGILTNPIVGGGPYFVQGQGVQYPAPPVIDTNGDGVPDDFAFGGNHFAPSLFVRDASGTLRTLYTGEAVRIRPNNYDEHQLITREDFNITDRDTVGVRYIYDKANYPLASGGSSLAGARVDVPSKNHNLGVSYTRTLSSRWVNEARFNFSRLFVTFGDVTQKYGPPVTFAGQRELNGYFSSQTLGEPNNLPQNRKVDVWQEQDTLSGTMGNHALKVGADIRQQKVTNFFLPNFLGNYRFNSGGTVPAGGVVCPLCTFYRASGSSRAGSTALGFENLLLGRPDRIIFALGNPNIKTDQKDFFFFGQDDWRIRPNLTLNLGLRYEVSTWPFNPIIDKLNAREANASTAIFPTTWPAEFRTARNIPTDKNNFAPRVGFAWSPNIDWLGDRFTNGRTVIRGGFGIAYDPSYFNIVLNTVTAAPFAAAGTLLNTPGVGPSFPFLPTTPAQLVGTPGTNGADPRLFNRTQVDPDFYNPYTMSFNLGVQQELWRNTVLEVRYVGSRILGQFQTVNGNPDLRFLSRAGVYFGNQTLFTHGVVPGICGQPTCLPVPTGTFQTRTLDPVVPLTPTRITGSGRLNPEFGPTRRRINGASSTYNGMQVRFDTRLRNDLALNVNYTWSRTIDNASEIFSTLAGGQTVAHAQDPFNITSGERGLSAFHQKHVMTSNFIYDLPFYKDQKGVAGRLLGGWEVSGFIRMGSGRPYTPNTFFGMSDPAFEGGFIGAGSLRPFNGNPSAPEGTIAFGYAADCLGLFDGPECATATPGSFIIYDTHNVGSQGVVVTAAQALQRARLIYNDFGMFSNFGIALADLEAFNLFKTPFGDVGRNTFFGRANFNTNLAVLKSFRITEGTKLEFRAEAQNVFNHRNFGVPDVVTEDAYFAPSGVGTFQNPGWNTISARTIRLGLRFTF